MHRNSQVILRFATVVASILLLSRQKSDAAVCQISRRGSRVKVCTASLFDLVGMKMSFLLNKKE